MKRLILLLAVVGGLALAIWSLLPNTVPVAVPTPSPRPHPSVSPTAAIGGVASLLPDERLAAAEKAAWPQGEVARNKDGERYAFARHILVDAPFGPVLVSEGKAADAAHVTAGRLDITYLRADGDAYAVARRFPAAVEVGSFGQMTRWSISDRYGALPVVTAEGGFTGQGYSCANAVLTELRPDGPAQIGQVQTLYDDSAAAVDEPGTTVEGRITDVVRGQGFDVRYTGTRAFTEHYALKNGRFLLEGKTQVPEC